MLSYAYLLATFGFDTAENAKPLHFSKIIFYFEFRATEPVGRESSESFAAPSRPAHRRGSFQRTVGARRAPSGATWLAADDTSLCLCIISEFANKQKGLRVFQRDTFGVWKLHGWNGSIRLFGWNRKNVQCWLQRGLFWILKAAAEKIRRFKLFLINLFSGTFGRLILN